MTKNIMIDLETMGTNSFTPIISIGAVYFDEYGIGEKFYTKVSLDSCLNCGMKIDADSVIWWLQQSDEARKEFKYNSQDRCIQDALAMFKDFYKEDSYVWGNGADFDIVILANAYKRVNLPVPWKFYHVCCFRTIRTLFPDIEAQDCSDLIAHNALHDAINQAAYAIEVLRLLKRVGNE